MEITEIKQALTLANVLHHYNLKPDKQSRLCCPFHEDKTPSMQVYYKTHTCYCFSSNCQTHGKSLDVIDFIMFKENVTKHEALKKAESLINGTSPVQSLTKTAILNKMFQYFRNAVANSKPAKDYIQSRGLDLTKLEIGYNTGQFHHGTRKEELLIESCLQVGLLSPFGTNSRSGGTAYKPFAKYCICFAMKNRAGNITGLYFRSSVNDSESKHFYLKDSTGLYPKYPNPETQTLLIAESIIDAASLLQIDEIRNKYSVLAVYGTNRMNDEIKTAIHDWCLSGVENKEIIFAFDNDEAGNKAVEKYSNELKEKLPKVNFSKLDLPCKDVNETLLAHSQEIFLHLIEKRIFLFSTENQIIQQSNTTEGSHEVNPIIEESNSPIIEKSNNLIYKSKSATYIIKGGLDKLLTKLNVTLEIVNEQLNESMNKRRFKLDLYDNKQIEKTISEAHEFLKLNSSALEQDLYALVDELDQYREKQQEKNEEQTNDLPNYTLTAAERNEALAFAQDVNLMKRITDKLTQSGMVGEDENKTFLFTVAVSHIQENPLNALIQGSSGSGKTNLLKSIYRTMPEESKKIYSRCSEKMLYNVPKYYFKNKLICFEDVDGLGEEAEYAWRELVSNGSLVSGVSYKDEKGNIGIRELCVYGPITSIACTTKGSVYADNMSRLFLIAIDESREQTEKINIYQAQEAAGMIDKKEQLKAVKEIQNFVRLLKAYTVFNPHATKLKLPAGIRDERRLYRLYLYFIDMITVLHQYQREKTQDGKLIATKQDCQIAKDLLFECIMLKMDELDGSLRQFFERLKDLITAKKNLQYEFTQREIREALKISKTHLQRFIYDLLDLEYLQQTSSHGNRGNKYKIQYFDDYRKLKQDVKAFLQTQIDALDNVNESEKVQKWVADGSLEQV